MKEWIKKHKMSLFVMIAAVVMLIGLSYAWLQITLRGEKELTLTSGTLRLVLDDSMDGGITMDSAVPVTDEEGKASSGYTFTLENTGTIDSDYEISIEDLSLTESQERMQDQFIKYQLTKDGEEVFLGILNDRVLDSGTITKTSKHTYTLKMWIDEAATNEVMNTVFKGKLKVEAMQTRSHKGKIAKVLFDPKNLGNGKVDTTDPEQTFITGEDPNNYIWYSGKLWRAVSKDTADNSVKLVTQWNQTALAYNSEQNATFQGSYMEEWLNDTSVDGFLGNLREPEKFIKMDSSWNATMMNDLSKPEKTTMVTDAVGLLNTYEYTTSYKSTTFQLGYLNNGLQWWSLTPKSLETVYYCYINGYQKEGANPTLTKYGVRPSINLKPDVEIINGDGTLSSPYRLKGDFETPIRQTLLNTRYSGEYIRFGTGENNLYRIVSHENGGTKIVSDEPLKESGNTLQKKFNQEDGRLIYTPTEQSYEIAYFLNNDYLDPTVGYLTSDQINMIETAVWYMGTVGSGESYKLGKYTDFSNNITTNNKVEAKVGLLRVGEQLTGYNKRFVEKDGSTLVGSNKDYWLLTPYHETRINYMASSGTLGYTDTSKEYGIRPSVNLKSSIKITGGNGTKNNPFTISE